MADQVILYISAAADLEMEREILGRIVTEVPVDLAWRVIQSPLNNGAVDLDAVVRADVHVLVLGGDIRAPIGLEWLVARQAGRQPTAFLKAESLRTPAGQGFVRTVQEVQPWRLYHTGTELRRAVQLLLADFLFDQAARYALRPDQISELQRWQEGLAKAERVTDPEARGAGDSSVVLSRDRAASKGGILLGGGA